MKMSYTRLMVENFDACFEFYARILGFPVTWGQKGDVYASFRVNPETEMALFKAELMDQHLGIPTESRRGIPDKVMLVFEAEDPDQVHATLTRQGVSCLNSPHDMPGWGGRCFHLRDPEGNLIEFFCELPKEAWSADLQEEAEKYQ